MISKTFTKALRGIQMEVSLLLITLGIPLPKCKEGIAIDHSLYFRLYSKEIDSLLFSSLEATDQKILFDFLKECSDKTKKLMLRKYPNYFNYCSGYKIQKRRRSRCFQRVYRIFACIKCSQIQYHYELRS